MGWRITKDHISDGPKDDYDRVGTTATETSVREPTMILMGIPPEPLPSPENEHPAMAEVAFRLYDDDGNLYYEGFLHDDDRGINQCDVLRFGEVDAGCTRLEVLRDGEWKQEIA